MAANTNEALIEVPEDLQCPVLRTMFRDPVVNAAGNTYERSALENFWSKTGVPYVDPLTNVTISHAGLIPNWDMRRRVQAFLSTNPDFIPEGWNDRSVPSPALSQPPEDENSRAMRHAIVVLSALVALLASALCAIASDKLTEVASKIVADMLAILSRHHDENNAVWCGLVSLLVAEVTFCIAWVMEAYGRRLCASVAFAIALGANMMAVTNFAAKPLSGEGDVAQPDPLFINVSIMTSLVFCVMIAICIYEVPLLRVGGRQAVRRLVARLVYFNGVLMVVLLIVLISLEKLVPGIIASPLAATCAVALASGSGLMFLGWPFLAGPRRWICVFLIVTGVVATSFIVRRADAETTIGG